MHFNRQTKGFFIFILTLVTLAFFNILLPYFSAILWAIILTVIFNPVKNRLCIAFGNRERLASFLTISIICLIVFIPMMIIFSFLAIELNTVYAKLHQHNTEFVEIISNISNHLPNWINDLCTNYISVNTAQIQKKLSETALQSGHYLAGSAVLIGKGTFSFAVNFGIMLYLLFFLLKDGQFLTKKFLNSLPLSNFTKQHLFLKFVSVSRATVKSIIIVAVVQGTLGSIAFAIVGIDGCLLWGAVIAFLSVIPAVGSTIIWIPIAFYLFIIHQPWQMLFIVSFFVIIVGLVDNLLRPLLVGKDTKIPDYLILISTLGGMQLYGINGFVLGPLIAGFFLSCWDMFSNHNHSSIHQRRYNRNNLHRKKQI